MGRKKILKKWWIKWPILFMLVMMGLFLGLYGSIYFGMWGKLPSKKDLADLSQMQATQVFDKDSVLIGKYFITNRQAIDFDDLPKTLTHALIATEDFRFYEHNGVDKRSLLRVFFKTLLMGDESSGGGSTITMQLAKNLFGRKDYGNDLMSLVVNKIRETFVARRLEEVYSKHEILALYFNTVPFSGNTYGIESAAQKFFNTDTEELTLAQSATLIGTLKANHSFNPRLFPERSQLRRDVVLHQMVKYGYLSEERAAEIMAKKIDINYRIYSSSKGLAPYFRQHIKQLAQQILANPKYYKPDGTPYHLKTDGLKIYTTLSIELQQYAEKAMQEHMSKLQAQFEKAYGSNPPWAAGSTIVKRAIKALPQYQKMKAEGHSHQEIMKVLNTEKPTELFGWEESTVKQVSVLDSLRHYLKFLNVGFVALDPHSGAVRAYIGGINYQYFQYDHVLQSQREVGSTFKPFVYTAALENGGSPCDYFSPRAVTYTDQDGWTPKNAGHEIDPDIEYSMTASLAQSLNTIAVKVLRQTGIENTINQVHKMGIDDKIPPVPSIALGTTAISVMEMAKAYTCYLNEGRPATPFFITKIADKHGNIIVDFDHDQENPRAFSENTREIMLEMLQAVVNKGTGVRLRSVYHFNNSIAGKTGTTQNNTDGWFIGLLPNLVTATWVGNDNHNIKFKTTSFGQGANSALPIFANLLRYINQDHSFDRITRRHFAPPSAKVQQAMDCPPTRTIGFFKRLFAKDQLKMDFFGSKDQSITQKEQEKKGFFKRLFQKNKKKKEKKKKKKKKGFFERLFGGKD